MTSVTPENESHSSHTHTHLLMKRNTFDANVNFQRRLIFSTSGPVAEKIWCGGTSETRDPKSISEKMINSEFSVFLKKKKKDYSLSKCNWKTNVAGQRKLKKTGSVDKEKHAEKKPLTKFSLQSPRNCSNFFVMRS